MKSKPRTNDRTNSNQRGVGAGQLAYRSFFARQDGNGNRLRKHNGDSLLGIGLGIYSDAMECPHCYEDDLDDRATRCKHCGGRIPRPRIPRPLPRELWVLLAILAAVALLVGWVIAITSYQ